MNFIKPVILSAVLAATGLGGIAHAQDGEKQYRLSWSPISAPTIRTWAG